jgi:hypothetical protein
LPEAGVNRSHWIPIGVFSLLLILVLVLQACNGKSPAAPGQISNYTPSNCTGIFGHNTAEASSAGPNDLWFNPFVAGSNSTLTSLSVYTVSASPITFEAGIYSNSVNQPGSLLTETGPVTSGPATQWNTASLQHGLALSSGVTY